ncbi:hypothetical protein H0H81_011459 [Sphagnurus paluster]|uniref:Uncharacterized protein n=1 Tax=Sphagnurus paluster TaxID=117069 RepID=A0A9P7K3H4_9AGAR|nr:hypothetical protein H0H81_011459 [Sphagnurus paluster]
MPDPSYVYQEPAGAGVDVYILGNFISFSYPRDGNRPPVVMLEKIKRLSVKACVLTLNLSNLPPESPIHTISAIHQMPPAPALLVEIVEHIVDLLSEDRASLLSCALVSHVFTAQSQKHLFNRVTLDFTDPRYGPTRAVQFVTNLSPRLARYIEHLSIFNYMEKYTRMDRKEHLQDTLLRLLLPKISKLQSFTLHGSDADSATGDLSPHTASLLITMLASAEVSEFNLSVVKSFPVTLLARYCPRIRRISCFPDQYYDPRLQGALNLAHLPVPTEVGFVERVVLWDTGASLPVKSMLYDATMLPGACLSFAHLREIEVRGCKESTLRLAEKLFTESAASASIKSLTCDFGAATRGACFDILLGSTYDLNFFRLPSSLSTLHVEIPDTKRAHFFSWLSAALFDSAEGSSPCPLEELVLLIHEEKEISPNDLPVTEVWDALPAQCATLDRALCMPAYTPYLRRVEIFIQTGSKYFCHSYDMKYPPMKPDITKSYLSLTVEGMYARLPGLCARKVVSVRRLITQKGELGLDVAVRALREGVEGPVYADVNGQFTDWRE